jgi:hypothetical protein
MKLDEKYFDERLIEMGEDIEDGRIMIAPILKQIARDAAEEQREMSAGLMEKSLGTHTAGEIIDAIRVYDLEIPE